MFSKAKKITCKAHDKYDQAEALIKEMSAGRDEQFFKTAMKNFDVLLQCILYRAAVADKKYARAEKNFLLDLTDYEDYPVLVTARSFKFRPKAREQFLEELAETADRASTAFVSAFAKVDADNKERDFLAELENCVQEIFFCFASVDGDDLLSNDAGLDEELSVLASSTGMYFSGKWEVLVAAFEGTGTV